MEEAQEQQNSQEPQMAKDAPDQSVVTPMRDSFLNKRMITILAAVVGVAVFVLIVGFAVSRLTKRDDPDVPSPTPTTILPTPTPVRPLSAISSSSAFLTLEASVASLSSKVNTFSTHDTTLNPPVIDLSLGLSQ